MKLSVIIPVYNAQNTIEKCVESIVLQKSNWSDIEIIICNDGSTDNSQEVLNALSSQYNWVIVAHLEKKGVSEARNYALSKVTGDYVWFIDSDDYVSIDSLNLIYKSLYNSQIEVLHFGYLEETAVSFEKKLPKYNANIQIDGFEFLEKNDGRLYLWNNIYKHSLLLESKAKFQESVNILEDAFFNLVVFSNAKHVAYLPETLYTYCYNPNSISKNRNLDHLLKLGNSSKIIHFCIKKLRDSYNPGSREFSIIQDKLMHSVLGFFYSLMVQKYPKEYVISIYKLYSSEYLIPIKKKQNNLKIAFFQICVNLKFPFLMLCKWYN
ncbi:MAG TPA: hypothetical protein DDZ41_03810 [Flavobacterium sp.]|nr:hypothetical protein [Flavobacterium sp.]